MQVFRGLFFVERKFIFWGSANQADGTSFFEINETINETIHEH